MDVPYTSLEALFHFVGLAEPQNHDRNYKTLCSILSSGCVTYSPRDLGWGPVEYTFDSNRSLLRGELIVPKMTCFADIPKEGLGIHTSKYGRFGLGIQRSHLVAFGARPVMYFPVSGAQALSIYGEALLRDIETRYRTLAAYLNDVARADGEALSLEAIMDDAETVLAKDFLAFVKPFNSDLDAGDKDNFYLEREWRKLGNVLFKPSNITTLFVAKGYRQRLVIDFPQFAAHEIREL